MPGINEKKPLIVVCGPTASGKTDLAVSLAQMFDCEIVSCDSMQIYKKMQIATAKPTPEQTKGIRHHLIDFLDPGEAFSVADFVKLANGCIDDILSRDKLPILCGGTGLYISSLIDNIKFDDACASPEIRSRLQKIAEEKGGEYLLGILREFDPESAKRLHPNNLTRIIRAIEVYEVSGITMTEAIKNSRRESPFNAVMIGITYNDRSKLYDRINMRIDSMLKAGLVEEAREILGSGELKTSYQAIGYKELAPYFNGEKTLDECIRHLKTETRRYAKRQLTWFRRDERINWIYPDLLSGSEDVLNAAADIIRDSQILKGE